MNILAKKVHDGMQGVCPYLLALAKSAVIAGSAGLLCGGLGTLFHYAVDEATNLRIQHPWLLYLLPVAGIVIAALYKAAGLENDRGTNLIIDSVRTDQRPPVRLGIIIFISTVLTHLCGGSSGREGAALQIGGSLGGGLGKLLHLNQKDRHVLIMCGMSGLFSALFGTPVTAALFSLEVISVGILHYSALLPCLFSALVAYYVSLFFGVTPVFFKIAAPGRQGFNLIWRVAVLALAVALVSILFCICMHTFTHLYQRLFSNLMVRAAIGGLLVVAVTLVIGTQDYNGGGMDIVARALHGQAVPWAFLLKIFLTALTLGAGFKGGEIVPSFFIGSTFGCVLGGLLGLDAGFGAALGLVGMFCGVLNCPVTSLLLSVELFGSSSLLPFALVCAISYLMSGPYSLYSSQKLTYSKIEPTFLNQSTK